MEKLVEIIDEVNGDGKLAIKGALCTIKYTGTLENGIIFDSTEIHGKPFQFVVGSKKIIQGMSLGIIGMKVGGIRVIKIPSILAYSDRQVGKIPPNSNLTFRIELLESLPRE